MAAKVDGKDAIPSWRRERGVQDTPELQRILKIPRRDWTEETGSNLAVDLTDVLKTPHGIQTLRPIQALALHDLAINKGLFGSILVGGGKCSDGETEVFDGKKRRLLKDIGAFQVAALDDGDIRMFDAVSAPAGVKNCVRLTLVDGTEVIYSDDHPVLTDEGYVAAGDLTDDFLVARARAMPCGPGVDMTPDEVALYGYLMADGGMSGLSLIFTDDSPEVLQDVITICGRLGFGTTVRPTKGRATHINVRGARKWRDLFGMHCLSKVKRVFPEFWGASMEQIRTFILNFWACDGYYHKDSIECILASQGLIQDLRHLLSVLGVETQTSPKRATIKQPDGSVKVYPAWRIRVLSHSVDAFLALGCPKGKTAQYETFKSRHESRSRNSNLDVVPFGQAELRALAVEWGVPKTPMLKFAGATQGQLLSRAKIEAVYAKYGREYTSGVSWRRVKSVEPVGRRRVFDVSVPGPENWVGNGVISHNTLVSFLAPYMVNSVRPLLIIPAKLVEKTNRDLNFYGLHWMVARHLRMVTYEALGRVNQQAMLDAYKPDLIIADEVHRLKNLRAAVTKRVRRFMENNPNTVFLALSGTITKRSILDYAHLLHWCFGLTKPIPNKYVEVEEWSLALDDKVNPLSRMQPGALLQLCNDEEQVQRRSDERSAVRKAYRRRIAETSGVISTFTTFEDASLSIEAVYPKMGAHVNPLFDQLRTKWETPDGWPISEPAVRNAHAREIGLGFFYRWNPRPPDDWLDARRAYFAIVRQILLSNQHNLDSELQVAEAISHRHLYPQHVAVRQRWLQLKDSFVPHPEAVWCDDSVLQFVAAWLERNKGIAWVEHVSFGQKLSELTGIPYYGQKGLTKTGAYIEDNDPRRPMICSIQANAEGRNLQKWNSNLVVSPPQNAAIWEQLIGRTHRPGQEADEVGIDVVMTCYEHYVAWEQTIRNAHYATDTTGQPQKVLFADRTMPTLDQIENWRKDNSRWNKG
jgi:hypothetical protein